MTEFTRNELGLLSQFLDRELGHADLNRPLGVRHPTIGDHVIRELRSKVLDAYAETEPAVITTGWDDLPANDLNWVGVDLDGTLARTVWSPDDPDNREIGPPIEENLDKLENLSVDGYEIVIHTSRGWNDYAKIVAWLDKNGVPYRDIQCGKPLFVAYVDNRAIRAEEKEWTPNHKLLRGKFVRQEDANMG